jgi:predicted RNA-binding protein with PIN domain
MAFLIDGHNLIGQLPDLALTDPDDEAKLVQKLISFSARTGKRCIVVFDSGLPGGKSRLSTGKVEVIFASIGRSADDVMKERIRKASDPGQWVVVSNDRAVSAAARTRRMTALSSADFAAKLSATQAAAKNKPRQRDKEEVNDVHVSAAEVEAWLKLFGGEGDAEK